MDLDLNKLFTEAAIIIQSDRETHKKYWKRGFIAATIYSIIYGFYEYFIVYNYIRLLDLMGAVVNWIIMYTAVVIMVALATNFKAEKTIFGLFYMTMLEDVAFWIARWIDIGTYPFPAGNWWDSTIATYRVLGGLGWAISFWPYVPFYYLPGFSMLILYYVASYKSAKAGRIIASIWGPFFIAIIVGALSTDLWAILCLSIIPPVLYIYFIVLLKKNDWKLIEN